MDNVFSIDNDIFFKKIVEEIRKERVVDNNYKLERSHGEIRFFGNGIEFRESTKVIDDNQLKAYWERLSTLFDKFHDFRLYSATPKLCAFINDKLVEVVSDAECDSWIYDMDYILEKKDGKRLTLTRLNGRQKH